MTFLRLYIHFADPETNAKFIHEISLITENRKTMGIEEMMLERAKKEGLETGLKKGRLKGREKGLEKGLEKGKEAKSYEVVKNLLVKISMTDAQAADIAGASVDFVKKVRRELKK